MSLTEDINQRKVLEAFSRQSTVFDEVDRSNEIIGWTRERVREEIRPYLHPGIRILELNCGTGIDALYFASLGSEVLATDQSADMLEQARRKWEQVADNQEGSLELRQLSFTDLDQLDEGGFSFLFSNFGGLNCSSQLDQVIRSIEPVFDPGGVAALVIMPPICPWEWALVFRGYFRTAFRRLRPRGASARVEGVPFHCTYYTPAFVKRHMGPHMEVLKTMSLCLTVPPPFMEGFMVRHPRWFRSLEWWENLLCHRYPFRGWGDHYLIILRKKTDHG